MMPWRLLFLIEAGIDPAEHGAGLDFGNVLRPRERLRRGLAGRALAADLGEELVEAARQHDDHERHRFRIRIKEVMAALNANEDRRARLKRVIDAVDTGDAPALDHIDDLLVVGVGMLANERVRRDRLSADREVVARAEIAAVEEVADKAVGRNRLPEALAVVRPA